MSYRVTVISCKKVKDYEGTCVKDLAAGLEMATSLLITGKNSLAIDPRRRGDWFGEQLTCLSHDACASLIVNCFGYQCRSEDRNLGIPMPLVAERT